MKIRVFTDGACSDNPGPGGWAAVFNIKNKCIKISGCEEDTTNNRMELSAVVNVLNKIISWENHYDNTYEIYSDSAYVVNAINNCWIVKWKMNGWKTTKEKDVKNKDLWESCYELLNVIKELKVNVKFIKVKGHSGNTFNELVDKIAKEESLKAKKKSISKVGVTND